MNEKLTCKQTAKRYKLTFNQICNYAAAGNIDAKKEEVYSSRNKSGKKVIWVVEMTQKTIDYLKRRKRKAPPKSLQVKKSKAKKVFSGACYNYANNAMGGYLIHYYSEL